MAETQIGDDLGQKVAKDSSDNASKKDKFDLNDIWGDIPELRQSQERAQAKIELPIIFVDNSAKAPGKQIAEVKRSNVLDPQADHSEAKNMVQGAIPRTPGDFADDLTKIIHATDPSGVKIEKDNKTKLVPDKPGDQKMPVIYAPGIEPGRIGLLMTKDAEGATHYTAFVAGEKDPKKTYVPGTVEINGAAARELGIEKALQNGASPKIDVLTLPKDKVPGITPDDPSELHSEVQERIHVIAEGLREKEAENLAARELTLNDPAKPDVEFGYRRTTRDAVELRKIAEEYRNMAKEAFDAADPKNVAAKRADFGKAAQKDITKYNDEINDQTVAARKAKAEVDTLTKQIADREKRKRETESLKPQLEIVNAKATAANEALENAKYNKSYAEYQLKISKDEEVFTRHMQARASAAAAMSLNPDMQGSLNGKRVVVNSGHWQGDPKFPGFEHDGIAEWKLNSESQDVYGEMLRMAGSNVKIVNQIDLPKAERTMTGLASAIRAAKPQVAISIHHDSAENKDSPGMNGTLTLHCAPTAKNNSFELADSIHKAKINYGGLDDRYNPRGISVGIREQCGRGIQGQNVGAPFILDEQYSTHKDQWPKAIDPKWMTIAQFSKVVGVMEFLNGSHFKSDPSVGKDYWNKIWDQKHMDYVWQGRKVGDW